MHVLYFHQHFSTPRGSSGMRSYEMARALLRDGHTVTMVCGSYAQGTTGLDGPFQRGIRRGIVDGIDVVEFDISYNNAMGLAQRTGIFFRFALGSIGRAMREPADVIFATTTPLTAGIPGIAARWLKRTPFVFEVRDLWPELPRAMGVIKNPIALGLMSALEWASYRSADRLIGLAPGIVEGIVRRGVSPENIALVPNGCDLALFSPARTPWRPEGVTADQLLAVFSGTHGQANGLDAVLDAAVELKRRGFDGVRFALVGEGREKPRLESRAKATGLDNVIFLGSMPKMRLAELLSGADIGLQILMNVPAFYYGTSPNKFFDYIASGLPVLNNYPGWLAEMIQANDCGLVVPPDNPVEFATALMSAARDRDALKQKGKNARALAEGEFSREKLAKTWVTSVVAAVPDPSRITHAAHK